MTRRGVLYALLILAAGARLLLAVAAMPPYAGLDEIQHVARLAFVAQNHRQPRVNELSVPAYLDLSIHQQWGALPDFAAIGPRWHDVLRDNPRIVVRTLAAPDSYVSTNYESQQPSLYYALLAPLRPRTDVGELRVWRLASAFFSLIVVVAAAVMLDRWFGPRGVVAAALIVSLPTWITLTIRGSNDALACALLALAVAVTAAAPNRGLLEALAWGLALATKLYTWPVAIVVPLFWYRQRASRGRMLAVVLAGVFAVGLTIADLSVRTRNPLGIFGFDRTAQSATPQPVAYGEMLKITLASGIWTSGQHNDALTLAGMSLYALPLLLIIGFAVARLEDRRPLQFLVISLAAFGVAQIANAMGFIRQARAAGLALPLGGKEGWYWYALAPLIAMLFAGAPRLAGLWVVAWDLIITEGALFHDFAGTASPFHPSSLFRWGPLQAPFSANLASIGIGPLASHLIALRTIHLCALLGLFLFASASSSASPGSERKKAAPKATVLRFENVL